MPRPDRRRAGGGAALDWACLIVATLARVYLVLMASLLVIAVAPMVLGWWGTVVLSGSMRPHIDPGDVVVLAPFGQHEPVPIGGVVTFTVPAPSTADGVEQQRLHRIVGVHEDGTFLTAGDANATTDSTPLHREQITGHARLLVPHIGLPSLWLRTGQFTAFGGWVLLTLVALWAVRRHALLLERAGASDDTTPGGSPAAESADGEARWEAASRRAALGLFVAASAAVVGLLRAPATSAGFTARTATAGSSWTVTLPPEPVLGRTASYRVLAATAVENDPWLPFVTAVDGTVGVSPGTRVDGLYTDLLLRNVTGEIHADTEAAQQAMADAQTLFDVLTELPATATLGRQLHGTLGPGTHHLDRGTLKVGTVILDAAGDPSARFVIRAPHLEVGKDAAIALQGGARADNVFWQADGDIVLGREATARGTFIAGEDIAMSSSLFTRGALHGRAIAVEGSIIMERYTVGP